MVAEYAKLIGKTGGLSISLGFNVNVVIFDVRVAFGRIDYQVRPVSGVGMTWVESSRVHILEESKGV